MADRDGRELLDHMQEQYQIFSDDELRLLKDGGISVSDTEAVDSEDLGEAYEVSSGEIADAVNFGRNEEMKGPTRGGLTAEMLDKERQIMAERYKYEQNHVQLEMSHQKTAFLKRSAALEREINRLKSEKKSLETLLDHQKREHDFKLLEREKKTQEELYELRKVQNQIEKETPGLKHKLEAF